MPPTPGSKSRSAASPDLILPIRYSVMDSVRLREHACNRSADDPQLQSAPARPCRKAGRIRELRQASLYRVSGRSLRQLEFVLLHVQNIEVEERRLVRGKRRPAIKLL